MGVFKGLKELLKWLPKIKQYASAVRVVVHYAQQAKTDIETIFDDVEGNEPSYLNEQD